MTSRLLSRRNALAFGLLAAGACAQTPGAAQGQTPGQAGQGGLNPPDLEHVFSARVTVAAPIELAPFGGERRRIIPITGGTVSGPRFNGVVLDTGADWQTIRESDGNTRLTARYAIRHDDGTVVSVTNTGVRRGPPDVMRRLAAGEIVDPSLYYFRAAPVFEVEPGPHGWLMENVFLCVGKRWPDVVELEFYRVD